MALGNEAGAPPGHAGPLARSEADRRSGEAADRRPDLHHVRHEPRGVRVGGGWPQPHRAVQQPPGLPEDDEHAGPGKIPGVGCGGQGVRD